jgi:repressor LexA
VLFGRLLAQASYSAERSISGKNYFCRDDVMPLTKRQRQILDYLQNYGSVNGYAPSFEEIAEQFNYNSLATVHEHLSNLERKGYIKRNYNESRAIEILASDVTPQAVELELLGAVAAGVPIEEMSVGETIAVPQDFVRRAGRHYVLKVRGNSMIEDHISDGDMVVVHDRQAADNGDMVIAMLDGDSATVKRFYRERDGRIRLQPSNDQLQPIYVQESQMRVQGIVVGVMRRY